mmetsp:Transcript_5388/g.10585  ORF Transcript_5388/g.10585 Transcript_5388/m.10585 type:complete len:242 (-) Transcript_5388:79-804(-)
MYIGLLVAAVWMLLTALWHILPTARADIYDLLLARTTASWYAAVLPRQDPGSRLLDVGIGTATALVRNKEIISQQHLSVVGIDPEREYVTKATRVIAHAGLGDAVKVHCLSIFQPGLRAAFAGKARFDAAYFSGSLPLMPDPAAALRCAAAMIKPGGKLYITQTFQNVPSPLMARLKPLLRRFTSVDFGRVAYAADVQTMAARAGLVVLEDSPLPGSVDTGWQTARLVVLGQGGVKTHQVS